MSMQTYLECERINHTFTERTVFCCALIAAEQDVYSYNAHHCSLFEIPTQAIFCVSPPLQNIRIVRHGYQKTFFCDTLNFSIQADGAINGIVFFVDNVAKSLMAYLSLDRRMLNAGKDFQIRFPDGFLNLLYPTPLCIDDGIPDSTALDEEAWECEVAAFLRDVHAHQRTEIGEI